MESLPGDLPKIKQLIFYFSRINRMRNAWRFLSVLVTIVRFK